MNSSLTSLYRKINPAASSPGGTTTDPGKLSSTGGWFIDRNRGPERDNILIDLCEEKPTNVCTVNSVAYNKFIICLLYLFSTI